MKRILLVLCLMATLLSACMAVSTNTMPTPVETEVPVTSSTEEPQGIIATEPLVPLTDATSFSKLPAAPFESQTYINETAGFALDYPTGWTIKEMVPGDRGSQIQFLSSPDLADAANLPEGATRVSATVYQWDPKNDLAAFIANQKAAWDASGFKILEEQPVTLELGLAATEFTVRTSDANVVFLVTALRDRYLILSGEGNLELAKPIMQRVRPISP